MARATEVVSERRFLHSPILTTVREDIMPIDFGEEWLARETAQHVSQQLITQISKEFRQRETNPYAQISSTWQQAAYKRLRKNNLVNFLYAVERWSNSILHGSRRVSVLVWPFVRRSP